MPKCPKCGAEIDQLAQWCKREDKYYFSLEENESVIRELALPSDSEDYDASDYECPECSEVIFHDYETAVDFLAGREVTSISPENIITKTE